MTRYFTAPHRPRSWIADDVFEEPMRHVPTVCDHHAVDTGLIDAEGNTIWRAPNPMGFIWNEGDNDVS